MSKVLDVKRTQRKPENDTILYCFFSVNKQLADKERVAAALENAHLLEVVNQCLDIYSKDNR